MVLVGVPSLRLGRAEAGRRWVWGWRAGGWWGGEAAIDGGAPLARPSPASSGSGYFISSYMASLSSESESAPAGGVGPPPTRGGPARPPVLRLPPLKTSPTISMYTGSSSWAPLTSGSPATRDPLVRRWRGRFPPRGEGPGGQDSSKETESWVLGLRRGFWGGTFRLDSRPSGAGFWEPEWDGKENKQTVLSEKEENRGVAFDLLTYLAGHTCLCFPHTPRVTALVGS